MHVLYLHGFGSGPLSSKGTSLGMRLAGKVDSYAIPDLEAGDFTGLTLDLIQQRVLSAIAALPQDGHGVLLIGSSLGGYVAALLAVRDAIPRVNALLLIAPAFGFVERWAEILGAEGVAQWRASGFRTFFHHAHQRDIPLSVAFLNSCQNLPAIPLPPEIPVVIVHGRRDETVDWRASRQYADQEANIDFHLIDGDHRLTEVRHEDLITWCAIDLLERTR